MLAFAPAVSRAAESRDASHFFSLNTGDLKAEAAEARADGKKALLVMFEQEGCPGCLYMKRNILNRKDVQDYYRQHFVNLSLDIWGAVPLRDFANREATEKEFAQTASVKGTPTFVFYDLSGNELVRIFGPVEDADEFLLLGQLRGERRLQDALLRAIQTAKTHSQRQLTMPHNLFGSLKDLRLPSGRQGKYYDLAALKAAGLGDVSRMPQSLRIVLESVLRNCDGKRVTEEHVRTLAAWQPNAPRTAEIPFVLARILLQDMAGFPVAQRFRRDARDRAASRRRSWRASSRSCRSISSSIIPSKST